MAERTAETRESLLENGDAAAAGVSSRLHQRSSVHLPDVNDTTPQAQQKVDDDDEVTKDIADLVENNGEDGVHKHDHNCNDEELSSTNKFCAIFTGAALFGVITIFV